MPWLSRILVCLLVVSSFSAALNSGCGVSIGSVPDAGSCSEARIAPFVPDANADETAVPPIRVDVLAMLIAVTIVISILPKEDFPATNDPRQTGLPPAPFLPMRD